MLGWRDARSLDILCARVRAHRDGCSRLRAGADLLAIYSLDGLGRLPRLPAVSGQSSATAPIPRPGLRSRSADAAGTRHHPAALERLIDRVRRANLRPVAQAPTRSGAAGHQDVLGPAAIPMDRAHQRLAADPGGNIARTGSVLADFRHSRHFATRRRLGRVALFLPPALSG